MEPVVSRSLVTEIEDALAQVSEIRAARVVTSPAGTIEEIHVLALPSKSPKQLVRDIESALMAGFGIEVDHKKISIAQLGQQAVHVGSDASQRYVRARIRSVGEQVEGSHAEISVTLEIDDEVFVGKAAGAASRTGRGRLVAEATLDAIEEYLKGAFTFALEDVDIIRLGRERIAAACVVLVSSSSEEAFAGSALVHENEKDSIVRATLDAINRRLGFLTTP